jgi:hypothetical protein
MSYVGDQFNRNLQNSFQQSQQGQQAAGSGQPAAAGPQMPQRLSGGGMAQAPPGAPQQYQQPQRTFDQGAYSTGMQSPQGQPSPYGGQGGFNMGMQQPQGGMQQPQPPASGFPAQRPGGGMPQAPQQPGGGMFQQPQGQPSPYGGSGGFGPQQPMHPVDAFHQMIDHPHGQQILQQRGWTPPQQAAGGPQRAVGSQAGGGMVQQPQGAPQPVAGNGQIQPPKPPAMPNPGLPRRV